jgi:ribosomal protein S12 methylthiotransferase
LKTHNRPHGIGIVSLGCAKNLVDSEVLMRQLDADHFRIFWDPEKTSGIDTAIINTCGFILDAKSESLDAILRFVNEKKKGRIKHLFVMGCLSERYREELQVELPEVDGFFGVNELKKIVERVGGTFRSQLLGERHLTTPSHFAYLKIAEGCNRSCSFCAIPSIRGRHLSVPMEELVRQAEHLAGQGVKELILISQDTTGYGLDLYKKRKVAELLDRLADVKGMEWIRLHYSYPHDFPLEVLDVINAHPNICKYLDLPLQHISSRILKSMRREVTTAKTKNLIRTIREKVPGIAIRTTLITGYPGETEKEFNELKEFVMESRFERLGVFTYSHEEGTPAFSLKDNVPRKVKEVRAGELMEIQERISGEINASRVGQVLNVLIDREENGRFIGRSEFDSPEIDNEVIVAPGKKRLKTGQFYPVRISGAEDFDLFGDVVVPPRRS